MSTSLVVFYIMVVAMVVSLFIHYFWRTSSDINGEVRATAFRKETATSDDKAFVCKCGTELTTEDALTVVWPSSCQITEKRALVVFRCPARRCREVNCFSVKDLNKLEYIFRRILMRSAASSPEGTSDVVDIGIA